MRAAFHKISFFIPDFQNVRKDIIPVLSHNFYFIAHQELITLLQNSGSVLCNTTYNTTIGIFLYIHIVIINLGIRFRFVKEKAGSKLTIRTFCNFLPVVLQVFLIFFRTFKEIVNRTAISSCHSRHIKSGFHTSLYF